ncbi:hypothetical protein HYS91_02410 [Candidatus Daviesbacteria bacterium]|nr:hypothetical protein [Candidatus Daviesbacteria bacterium]
MATEREIPVSKSEVDRALRSLLIDLSVGGVAAATTWAILMAGPEVNPTFLGRVFGLTLSILAPVGFTLGYIRSRQFDKYKFNDSLNSWVKIIKNCQRPPTLLNGNGLSLTG